MWYTMQWEQTAPATVWINQNIIIKEAYIMTKIDIFSGFLGAGKTTLIKKLIREAYQGEQLVLIENEFGEIGIDGGFLQDAGINITEMNSGCICCSLVGDFGKALRQVMEQYHPDRILIEPSGVGKLSDVIRAVENLNMEDAVLNGFTTVADASKCKMYMKNFGEFFNDQIEHASSIVLSRTAGMKEQKLNEVVALLREHNAVASIITTPWDELTGKQILETMEQKNTLQAELKQLALETARLHEEEEEDEEECCCGHHHHDHEDEHTHHHHHDHEHEEDHDHDHEDDGECCCGHHHHDHEEHDHEHEHEHHHHHHHHADEVFISWGVETPQKYTLDEIEDLLGQLNGGIYGAVLRAKGIVEGEDGRWIHFDFVPGEQNVRYGAAATIGRLCVIGAKLDEHGLKELFRV